MPNDKITKITDFAVETPECGATKRPSSEISPAEKIQIAKKANIESSNKTKEDQNEAITKSDLQQLLEPLVKEFKSIRESLDQTNSKLDTN